MSCPKHVGLYESAFSYIKSIESEGFHPDSAHSDGNRSGSCSEVQKAILSWAHSHEINGHLGTTPEIANE